MLFGYIFPFFLSQIFTLLDQKRIRCPEFSRSHYPGLGFLN